MIEDLGSRPSSGRPRDRWDESTADSSGADDDRQRLLVRRVRRGERLDLNALVDRINDLGAGVTASVVFDDLGGARLVRDSRPDTGSANELLVEASGPASFDFHRDEPRQPTRPPCSAPPVREASSCVHGQLGKRQPTTRWSTASMSRSIGRERRARPRSTSPSNDDARARRGRRTSSTPTTRSGRTLDDFTVVRRGVPDHRHPVRLATKRSSVDTRPRSGASCPSRVTVRRPSSRIARVGRHPA